MVLISIGELLSGNNLLEGLASNAIPVYKRLSAIVSDEPMLWREVSRTKNPGFTPLGS